MERYSETITPEMWMILAKGIQLKSLYPTPDDIAKVQLENPDYIVTGAYGKYILYQKQL